MTRAMQEALHLPLLLELSARGKDVVVQHGYDGINEVLEFLRDACPLPEDYAVKCTSNGDSKFRNDMLWAKKQLVEMNQINHEPRVRWWLTESGSLRLRQWLLRQLKCQSHDQVREFCFLRDENDRELFIHVLGLLDETQHSHVVQQSHLVEAVLLNSIELVSPSNLTGFTASYYEILREWMKGEWIDAYKLAGYSDT